jgi:hypothetical protein
MKSRKGRRLGCSEAETQLSRKSPGVGESTPGENPTRRHSGLDPESRIVNFGAKRR